MIKEQLKNAILFVLNKCCLTINEDVINMLLETACVESNCGQYIKQVNGPACGVFQIEPNTAKDIQNNFLKYKSKYQLYHDLLYIKSLTLEENLCYNLAYSIFMCRMFYLRIKETIPNTVEERAKYWKKYYNTELGKGTVEKYLEKAKKYGNI